MIPDSDDLAKRLGEALGEHYEVESLLGAGGFATVYLVRDLSLKRPLAVKVLSPDLITSKAVLERFRREAETIAQLSHPHIVPLHFIGQQGDLLYLAMACVNGGSVAERIKRERLLPVDDAARIMAEVASALGYAHRHGVVHRDIKPANVLIDQESGRCLVTDFGIARTADGGSLTASGVLLGTPAYLSPEQLTGESNDHRVDIFALGVMAYEMLSGRVPFDGLTPTAAIMRRLAGPPEPLTTLRADVPEPLASVIDQCLAPNPAERFQHADDVVQALGDSGTGAHRGIAFTSASHRAHSTTGASRRGAAGSPKRSRLLLTAAIAGSVLVASVVLYSLVQPRGANESSVVAADSSMVEIPAGSYVIGTDGAPESSRPQHRRQLGAFAIERTEVTVGAYRDFVVATKARAPWGNTEPDSRLPVTHVTWGDAANYCAWRYRPDGRLPTEFEWEAAARGLTGRRFPWGNTARVGAANTDSLRDALAPVGSFPRSATPDGLQDMLGNAWEWTASVYASYPGGRPQPDYSQQYRVIRGGAYDSADEFANPWHRGYQKASAPPEGLATTGFRCARTVASRPSP